MPSATPTPSPRHSWFDSTPRRPTTGRAAHTRSSSYSQQASYTPRPSRDSPRYNSSGEYATVDVSACYDSPLSARYPPSVSPKRHDRRHSYTYARASTPYGESDEDEIIETLGGTYVLPAESRSHAYRYAADMPRAVYYDGGRETNRHGVKQACSSPYYYVPQDYDFPAYVKEPVYESPRSRPEPQFQPQPQPRPPTSTAHRHVRRSSASVPQRPSTARPAVQRTPTKSTPTKSTPTKATSGAPAPAATPQKATEVDAKRHKIPTGYSLKNWDPKEQPILLLGSVFDANSLGKWIYDWTVFREGPIAPKSEMAGELWLLLIQLSTKIKRGEEIIGRVRSSSNRELMSDFLESGDRLMRKLRELLKACEAPMLKVAKKKQGLGKNSGVEFVDTLFGVERQGADTDDLMQKIRLFNFRFDANCEDILNNPTM